MHESEAVMEFEIECSVERGSPVGGAFGGGNEWGPGIGWRYGSGTEEFGSDETLQ